MSEAELVYQYGDNVAAAWDLIKWWVSVSFSVIAVSHFSGSRINIVFLVGIIAVYEVFSVAMAGFINHANSIQIGVVETLRLNTELSDAGRSVAQS